MFLLVNCTVSHLEFTCVVVYLDADAIVVKSIEDLFKCEMFCANLKHCERLNSGIMVVEPAEAVFSDMMNVREQLEESLPGTGGGKNPNDELLVEFLFLLPFCSLLFCCYRSFLQTGGPLCRTSLCNQIRHLYYIFRSSGTVAYTGVSSSSTINANSQFPNGAQTKVPAYLGGISVFAWNCYCNCTSTSDAMDWLALDV
ncbi:hypothetical protein CRYUN_Cryun05aG0032400 [Craigia yunnanensis]